jgi:hypothetical protein
VEEEKVEEEEEKEEERKKETMAVAVVDETLAIRTVVDPSVGRENKKRAPCKR